MSITLKRQYSSSDSALDQNKKHKDNLEYFIFQLNEFISQYPDLSNVAQKDLANVLNSVFAQKGLDAGLASHQELLNRTISFATLENGKSYLIKIMQDGTKTYYEFNPNAFADHNLSNVPTSVFAEKFEQIGGAYKNLSNVENSVFKAKAIEAGINNTIINLSTSAIKSILISEGIQNPTEDQIGERFKQIFNTYKITDIETKNIVIYTDILGHRLMELLSYEEDTKILSATSFNFRPDGFNVWEIVRINLNDFSIDYDSSNFNISLEDIREPLSNFIEHKIVGGDGYNVFKRNDSELAVFGKFVDNVLNNQCISINQAGSGAIIASNQKYASFDEIVDIAKIDNWTPEIISKVKAKLGIS